MPKKTDEKIINEIKWFIRNIVANGSEIANDWDKYDDEEKKSEAGWFASYARQRARYIETRLNTLHRREKNDN